MDDGDNNNDGRITVTLASTAIPKSKSSSGAAREDFWTEAATSVLIDAWGERYLALSRGNLKQQHWKEVADVVNNSSEMNGRSPKSDMQCKNRIDTVKKKYKLEKSKMGAGTANSSSWSFFRKMDYLIGPNNKTSAPSRVVNKSSNVELRSLTRTDSSKSEQVKSADSTDSDSPKSAKKRRISNPNSTATSNREGKKKRDGGSRRVEQSGMRSSSIGELTKAIMNLGEVYEQAEGAKMRQVMEMEKHRMKFTKDLELQRMQLFMKTQLEITQMKEDAMSSYRNKTNNNNHLHHQLHTNHNNNDNISNLNSDSTSK